MSLIKDNSNDDSQSSCLKRQAISTETEYDQIRTKREKKTKIINKDNVSNISNNNPGKCNIVVSVDKECQDKLGQASVFIEGNVIYDAMLNQTNLQLNNNKFYIIQLLKDNDKESYSVWTRWARVGKVGQKELFTFGKDLNKAKECFCKKFYDKTHNNWNDHCDFQKVNGKYDWLRMDYGSQNDQMDVVKDASTLHLEPLQSQLDIKIQSLLKMIFDIKEINSTVTDLHYDANKLPLGRLTETQIKSGYVALREIEEVLNEGIKDNGKLVTACDIYYTRIPHDFGMKVPPVIRSKNEIKKELELLETLSDIKITLSLLDMGDVNLHPLDRQYKALECQIKPLNPTDDIYKILNIYLVKNHGATHNNYSLELMDIFEIKKKTEWDNFQDLGNKMLLWHGSRTTNYGGILSQGLRIAPPEAPVTGHMFGKGVYFSDMSSKSANYIYSSRSKNIGFLLLCEVSLGNCHKLIKADAEAFKLRDSVKGCGIIAPKESEWITLEDGLIVPQGEPCDTGLSNMHNGYLLNYNEFIVYNTNQIRMRYIVKVRFKYK